MPSDKQTKQLPPLFINASKDIAGSEIFTSFPKPSFIENIAVDEAGDLYVTSLEEGTIYKLYSTGEKEIYASIAGKPAGICFINHKTFLLNGWDENGVSTIWLLKEKKISFLLQPKGALFLNGMTLLDKNHALICDSYKGCLWKYNLDTNTVEIWLEHLLLKRSDESSAMPAANGIKVFKDKVFVSNTDKHLLLSIAIAHNTPQEPEIFLTDINLDDFAIDNDGNIYAATHIYNSVVRITPDKKIIIITEAAQGATGSTAVAFGKREHDADYIYVTTNGGLSLPHESGLEDGKVIKIKVS